jgi:hypothetical protein
MEDKDRKQALVDEYEKLSGKRIVNQPIEWLEKKIQEIKNTGNQEQEQESTEPEQEQETEVQQEQESTVQNVSETEKEPEEFTVQNISDNQVLIMGVKIAVNESAVISGVLLKDEKFITKLNRSLDLKILKRV